MNHNNKLKLVSAKDSVDTEINQNVSNYVDWVSKITLEIIDQSPLYLTVQEELLNTKNSLRKFSYQALVININKAKNAWIDVSSIEIELPELLRKILRNEVDLDFKTTNEDLRRESYNYLEKNLNIAIDNWIEVNDIQAQMPELLKKVTFNEIQLLLRTLNLNLNRTAYDMLCVNIKTWKDLWYDVANFESLLPNILKSVIRKEAELELINTEHSLKRSSYTYLVFKVQEAKKYWVDVSNIENKMPDLLIKIESLEK